VRRFTVRIRLNACEPNAELARPGTSVETADATIGKEMPQRMRLPPESTASSTVADEMAVERPITHLPQHPRRGRARPQGPSGITYQ